MVPLMRTCRGCGGPLDPFLAGSGLHPTCTDEMAEQVTAELQAIIRWASDTSPRSLQTTIGPSELGTPCDRRLAYRLAGSKEFNHHMDPLISVVGTGLHSWLEAAVRRFNATFGDDTLIPESEIIYDDEGNTGRSDLYHRQLQAVIDFKSCGPDVLKKLPDVGPERGHRVQGHLYGGGYIRAGLPVKQIMLAYIPRSGLLRSIYVWREPYDPQVAMDALRRRDELAALVKLTGPFDPRQYATEGVTEKDCWFCPYKTNQTLLGATAEYGCPGPG